MSDPSSGPSSTPSSSPSEIEADIARTRADLAATVDQLAAKAGEVKQTSIKAGAIAGGVLVVALVTFLVVRRVRS